MVELIADGLRSGGEYRTELSADPPQRVVDTWWAAHAAGRLVGGRVQIANECRTAAMGQQSMVIVVRLQGGPRSAEADGWELAPGLRVGERKAGRR